MVQTSTVQTIDGDGTRDYLLLICYSRDSYIFFVGLNQAGPSTSTRHHPQYPIDKPIDPNASASNIAYANSSSNPISPVPASTNPTTTATHSSGPSQPSQPSQSTSGRARARSNNNAGTRREEDAGSIHVSEFKDGEELEETLPPDYSAATMNRRRSTRTGPRSDGIAQNQSHPSVPSSGGGS